MDARVIVDKKTTKISKRHRGYLRLRRLYEAEQNGELMKIETRRQLGEMLGITNARRANQYIYGLIHQDKLSETTVGFKGKRARYEYHTTPELLKVIGQKPSVVKTVPKDSLLPPPNIEAKPACGIVISKDGWEVRIENATDTMLISIIKAIGDKDAQHL